MSISYINFEDIKNAAHCFLSENWTGRVLPVPVDFIAEQLGIDIVSGLNLMKKYGIDAFLSHDLCTITVDQNIYDNQETRYRFSVSHELGHYYLHRDFYQENIFGSIEEWVDVYTRIDDRIYSMAETQANNFGAVMLMPDSFLQPLFEEGIERLSPQIDMARQNGLSIEEYKDSVIRVLSLDLARMFNVSKVSMEYRLKNDKSYYNIIP